MPATVCGVLQGAEVSAILDVLSLQQYIRCVLSCTFTIVEVARHGLVSEVLQSRCRYVGLTLLLGLSLPLEQ